MSVLFLTVSNRQVVGQRTSPRDPMSEFILVFYFCYPKFPQVVDRIQFLVFVGLRSSLRTPPPFFFAICQVNGIPCFKRPPIFLVLCPHPPSIFKAVKVWWSPSPTLNLSSSSFHLILLTQLGKILCF